MAQSFDEFLTGDINDWQAAFNRLLLSEMPQEAYYSSPTGRSFYQSDITNPFSRRSPRRQRFFDQSYQNVYRDFLGATGAAQRAGTTPPTFMEFTKTDPWTRMYTSLPQSARGRTGSAYNPRTRFSYNF